MDFIRCDTAAFVNGHVDTFRSQENKTGDFKQN